MPTFQDGSKLAAIQAARARALLTRVKSEHAAMVNALYEEGFNLLSGGVSAATQRALGHPYGRGVTKAGTSGRQRRVAVNGVGTRLPAMPVNTQTGRLREALQVNRRGVADGQHLTLSVSKSVRYARYVLSPDGTRRMVTRPFWAAIIKSWRKRNFDLLARAREAGRQP